MRRIITPLLAIALTFLFPACKKTTCNLHQSGLIASAAEIATIQNYLTTNSLTATQHSNGLFYSITDAGTGDSPDLCSSVTVRYKGSLTNGVIFDQSTNNVSFPLSNLIIGWQHGIPLIKKGGKITLYIPPSLGYGSASQSGIPGNSTLIFEIELIGFVK